jgi:uncharacterized protein YkwD
MLVAVFCCVQGRAQNYSVPGNARTELKTEALQNYCLTLINSSRKTEPSLAALTIDPALNRLATKYAEYMLQHPEYYEQPKNSPHLDLEGHIPMDRARSAGINVEVHENLGMGTRGRGRSDAMLIVDQHRVMMAEPLGQHNHRTIIMDPLARAVGIGIGRDATHLYLVEEFGH